MIAFALPALLLVCYLVVQPARAAATHPASRPTTHPASRPSSMPAEPQPVDAPLSPAKLKAYQAATAEVKNTVELAKLKAKYSRPLPPKSRELPGHQRREQSRRECVAIIEAIQQVRLCLSRALIDVEYGQDRSAQRNLERARRRLKASTADLPYEFSVDGYDGSMSDLRAENAAYVIWLKETREKLPDDLRRLLDRPYQEPPKSSPSNKASPVWDVLRTLHQRGQER